MGVGLASSIKVGNSGSLTDTQIDLIDTLRDSPAVAAKVLLGVDLYWYQIEAIEDFFCNKKRFALLKWSRQMGKTYLEAVAVALQCILYPEEVGIFLAPSQRQSLNPMHILTRYYNNSEIFQGLVERKTKGIMRFKNGSEILSLPMGDGCVSDCFIMRYDGFKKIDDILCDDAIEKDKVFIKGKISGKDGFNDAEYYFYNGFVDIKDVKTNYGYELKGSLIHPVLAVRDNKTDWIRYSELQVGDKVIIDRKEEWFPECNDLQYDDAYSIGALIGDASYCTESEQGVLYRIGFSNNPIDDDIVKYINGADFIRKYELEFKRLDSSKYHLYAYGKDGVNNYLKEFGIDSIDFVGNKTKNKQIPPKVLGCSKNVMVGFIQGLFDTDGSVCKSEHKDSGLWLEFTNTSYELVRVLQIILLKFGIISNVRDRKRGDKWNIVYDLFITGTNVKKFSERIGFRLKRKQERLEKLLSEKKRDYDVKDLIPHAPYLVLELISKIKIVRNTNYIGGAVKLCLSKARENFKNGIGLTYQYVKNILDFFKEYSDLNEYKNLKDVYDKHYFYDEIVEIKDDKADTYDAYIPGDHTFGSNGFISHNSKILGSHGTIIGIDEYARFTQDYITTVILPMLNQPGANGMPNKLITLSTPLSKQNHFYQWYLTHRKYLNKDDSLYHLSEYDYRDSDTIDLDIIQLQYENSTWEQFARENLGIFTDNIDGYFPNELIYSCDEEEDGSIKVQVVPQNSDLRYVLGVDPSNMVMKDKFSIYLYQIIDVPEKGIGLQFANGWSFDNRSIPEVENLLRRVMRVFPVIRCNIDAGGGGRQIAEHLMEPLEYFDEILNETIKWSGCKNADISDKTPQFGGSETAIKIIPYSSEKKNRMFFNLKNIMTRGLFKLPKTNYYDKSYIEANLLKDELENITTRTLPNNLLAFDHPENVGDDRANASALAIDAMWDVFYGQTESSATMVRGVGNRRPSTIFGDFGKPRDFSYKQRELSL